MDKIAPAVLGMLLLIAIATGDEPQHTDRQDPLASKDAKIFATVLDYTFQTRFQKHAGSYYVVMNRTHHYCKGTNRSFACIPCFPPSLKNGLIERWIHIIHPELEKEFHNRNENYGAIESLNVKENIKLISPEEIDTIFETGFWPEFYKHFPDSGGIAMFTLPAYTPSGSKAVVYFRYAYGGFGGEDFVLELEAKKDRWIVTTEHVIGVS